MARWKLGYRRFSVASLNWPLHWEDKDSNMTQFGPEMTRKLIVFMCHVCRWLEIQWQPFMARWSVQSNVWDHSSSFPIALRRHWHWLGSGWSIHEKADVNYVVQCLGWLYIAVQWELLYKESKGTKYELSLGMVFSQQLCLISVHVFPLKNGKIYSTKYVTLGCLHFYTQP